MKYNLKNFPSNDIYYIDTWAHTVKKWKAGFEKELREAYELQYVRNMKTENTLVLHSTAIALELIREILGDSK